MRKIIFLTVLVSLFIAHALSIPVSVKAACVNWCSPSSCKDDNYSCAFGSCCEWVTDCCDAPGTGSQNCGAGSYACNRDGGCCPIDSGAGSGTHGNCSCGTRADGTCKSCGGGPGGCVANCTGKACGDDGCGGGCGVCPGGTMCSNFSCICAPSCIGRTCGNDTCNTMSCGTCVAPNICSNNNCVCVPNCTGRQCGLDSCNQASCGTCAAGSTCVVNSCNIQPSMTSLTLNNSSGSASTWDAGSRDHICKSTFLTDPLPRNVTYSFVITDPDGGADIATAQMRWNGTVTPLTLGPVVGNTRTATATIAYAVAANNANAFPIYISLTDSVNATGWVLSGYSWKVWDCNVPVLGNIYDSSDQALGGQCPSGAGFSTLATSSMNFQSVLVEQITPYVATTVNKTDVSSYSAGNLFVWGKQYKVTLNASLTGSGIVTRWVDLGAGTTMCGTQNTIDGSVVSAYSAAPSIKIDFSAIGDQEPWFSVYGGGVQGAGTVASMVPITCALNASCVAAMTAESAAGEADNGIISGTSVGNNSGCSMNGSQCAYGKPNNWYKSGVLLTTADKNSYAYFYEKYFSGLGLGVTMAANATMTNVNGVGSTGVIFVNGNFNVDTNNIVPVGKFLMIIVKGTVNFDPAVSQSAGIFVADGGIAASGTSASQLVIDGMLYSSQTGGTIRLNRGYVDKTVNNTSPAVLVRYRPDFLFNIPGLLTKLLSGWSQY